jgi:hypothetical protein
MLLSTALKEIKTQREAFAMTRASVVLPTPGGPHHIIEANKSRSICVRRGFPGPSKCSCPT